MNTDKIYAESIANEYAAKATSKVLSLKKLDAKAKRPSKIFTYTFGIVSALILGIGMCLSMQVIGSGSVAMTAFGIVLGLVGIAGASVNYPLYKKILEKGKQKYAADVIALAKEISED
ncbi:MAG: dihydropteridine reductase [Candidatus Borkfalkia sp.]